MKTFHMLQICVPISTFIANTHLILLPYTWDGEGRGVTTLGNSFNTNGTGYLAAGCPILNIDERLMRYMASTFEVILNFALRFLTLSLVRFSLIAR